MTKRQISAPYHVGIASTCSGAWPVIYAGWNDPDTGNDWNEVIGETPSAFIMDYDAHEKAVSWNEEPHSFKLTKEGSQSIANAYLFAAAPMMRDVLREVMGASQNATLRDLAMQALDATTPPAELPQEDPEAQ